MSDPIVRIKIIAHDYEGVDLKIVEQALLFGLPGLQASIDKIINKAG